MAKPDWITLSKSSGLGNDTISVEAQPNAQRYCREGTITVNSGNGSVSKQVKVSQFGAAAYRLNLGFIGVQDGALYKITGCFFNFVTNDAEDEAVTYTINVKLLNEGLPFELPDGSSTISLTASFEKGATVSSTGDLIFDTPFKVGSKQSLTYFSIKATSTSGSVWVDKAGSTLVCKNATLIVKPQVISVDSTGTTTNVSVEIKKGDRWVVENNIDWMASNPNSQSNLLTITVAENTTTSTRDGVITVRTASGLISDIQVIQAGKVANSIKGSGSFCDIGIPTDVFPTGVSQVTVCAIFNLSTGNKVEAGYVTLSIKDAQDGLSIGEMSFNCERESVPEGAKIRGITLACNAGPKPWDTLFDYFLGDLEVEPTNMGFKVAGTTKRYPATFKQFNAHMLGFDFTTPIPISGDTTLVISDSEELPAILISRISR